jgi:hypothetical protein
VLHQGLLLKHTDQQQELVTGALFLSWFVFVEQTRKQIVLFKRSKAHKRTNLVQSCVFFTLRMGLQIRFCANVRSFT